MAALRRALRWTRRSRQRRELAINSVEVRCCNSRLCKSVLLAWAKRLVALDCSTSGMQLSDICSKGCLSLLYVYGEDWGPWVTCAMLCTLAASGCTWAGCVDSHACCRSPGSLAGYNTAIAASILQPLPSNLRRLRLGMDLCPAWRAQTTDALLWLSSLNWPGFSVCLHDTCSTLSLTLYGTTAAGFMVLELASACLCSMNCSWLH